MLSTLSCSSLNPEGNLFFDKDIFGVVNDEEMLAEAGGLFLATGVHGSHDHFITAATAVAHRHTNCSGLDNSISVKEIRDYIQNKKRSGNVDR